MPKCNQNEEVCKHILAVQCGIVSPTDFGVLKLKNLFTGQLDKPFFATANLRAMALEQPGPHEVLLKQALEKHGKHPAAGTGNAGNGTQVDHAHADSVHAHSAHEDLSDTHDYHGSADADSSDHEITENDLFAEFKQCFAQTQNTPALKQELLNRLITFQQETEVTTQSNPDGVFATRPPARKGTSALQQHAMPFAGDGRRFKSKSSTSRGNGKGKRRKRPNPNDTESDGSDCERQSAQRNVRCARARSARYARDSDFDEEGESDNGDGEHVKHNTAHDASVSGGGSCTATVYGCIVWAKHADSDERRAYYLVRGVFPAGDRWESNRALYARYGGAHLVAVAELTRSHPWERDMQQLHGGLPRPVSLPCRYCAVQFPPAENLPGDSM
jgi:hypothetical protein